jgi:NitT/TauT family transport system ATP-binding protein
VADGFLEVDGVAKAYGQGKSRLDVLIDISFKVRELEFVSLLGPSGCGKSTLLRIIDGLIEPGKGSVIIAGEPVKGPGRGRGMVFQGVDLFPWRTALGNVEFGLEMSPIPRRERRSMARHYLDLVGLGNFEGAYPYQLSGGMQQRVGIARALAIKPQVLLMDEPFGALDVQTRDLLQDELLRIWQQEPKTVIFVTHSIEEAIYLSDRIVVMTPRPGRIDRTIDVSFPRPRDEALKGTPAFVEMRREIWALLKAGARG